jgi:hypothetical protein
MRSACSSNGTTHSSGTINKRQHANRIDADALRFAGRPSTRERTRSTDDPPHRGNVTDSDHEPSPPIRSRRARLADRTLPKHASGSSTVDPTQPRGPHSRARTGLSRPETRLPVVLHVVLAMRDRRPRGRFRRNTHMPIWRGSSRSRGGIRSRRLVLDSELPDDVSELVAPPRRGGRRGNGSWSGVESVV